MWTTDHRARQVRIAGKTKRYRSDLTDEEWAAIEPFLPKPAGVGSPRRVDMREVLNAIRYLVRSGCAWAMLPAHFPPWQTVYWWFRRLARRLMFRTIHDIALMIDRALEGRAADPTAAVIDSQTVKAPAPKAERGFDGAKRMVGRKRHIAVDTGGRLLFAHLTPANVSDSAGAQAVLDALHTKWPWIKQLFADSAYDRRQLMDKAAFFDFTLDIVKRTEPAFVVLPRRWVVERTLGWMTRHRRLVRDYEARIDMSEAMIDVALGGLMIRRAIHP